MYSKTGKFFFKKSITSALSGSNRFLSWEIMSAALLKRHSDEAEDAGMDKYLHDKWAKACHTDFFSFQY